MLRCDSCNKNFTTKYHQTRHLKSHRHAKILNDLDNIKNIEEKEEFKIPLKNKKGDIVGETLVDKDVYIHIFTNHYIVCKSLGHVAILLPAGVKKPLHVYIFHDFYKNEKTLPCVDHINRDPFDNRLKNLRQASYSTNSRNKSKSKKATSRYYGVSYIKRIDMWRCRLLYKNIDQMYIYKNENDAAYHYDLLIIENNLQDIAPMNDVEKPENFILKTNCKKKDKLPTGIFKRGNTYGYSSKGKQYYSYKTSEEAIEARNNHIEKEKLEKESKRLNTPIKRKDGVAIIELFNKTGEQVGYTMIDDEKYYDITKYKWCRHGNYVHGQVDKKYVRLSRFVLNCTDINLRVDHIDNNPLNNRKENLRICTAEQNSQNKLSSKNSTSKFTGVCFVKDRKKWKAQIINNKKYYTLGRYNTEIEAAKARDKKALYFNQYKNACYKLNFP